MTKIQTTNFYNPKKSETLLEYWCKENLLPADYKRWQKQLVNYATMEEVEKFVFANKADYIEQIIDKKTKQISDEEIVLDQNYKYLRMVFFSSAHYYDVGNPQMLDNRKVFQEKVAKKADNTKTVVVFAGDLLGTEWKMKNFRDAKFVENEDGSARVDDGKGNVVLYYGLNKRMQELERDVKYALKSGADVYLMRGAEEHDIYRSVGRNILKEVFERVQAKCEKDGIDKSRLHYINEGASLKVNFARKKDDGTVVYGTIGLQTNNTDKAFTTQGSIKASEKSNGQLNADIKFVANANAVGNFGNAFYISPQSKYLRTPHGKKPTEAPRDNDVFVLSMEEPHNIQVRVGDFVPDIESALKIACHREQYKNRILLDIVNAKMEREKIREIVSGRF